jgi:peptidyl-prolyl cis-trans isomerase D
VKADESELKAKYEEMKDLFRTNQPSRDIKFIDVPVQASKADRDEIIAELQEVATQMQAENADFANIIRKSGSIISYSALPVRRAALASDIAKEIDSMAVGTQKGPYLNIADNTQNIVRLIAKTTLPDSVQIRQIGIGGMDEAANKKTADSIMTALNAGVPFDSIAKKYNQTGEAQWITSSQYERATLDDNNLKFINAINAQAVGTTQQIKLGTGIAIVRVDDRKNMVEKYQVAVVKRPIDFSNDTFNKTYNDFSQFVASNKTPEEIEANAVKAGYMVQQRADIFSSEHNVAGLSATREAFRWIFNDDTKVGEISEIYTCGNNDHLLVVILTGKNDGKFSTLESEAVKAYVEEKVLADKKAGILQEKMEGCADIQAVAKLPGAQTDTIRHITFASPVFVPSVGGSENALSGAVAKTAKGGFMKGVKGNAAVYAFQVINETKTDAKLDDAAKQNITAQINASNFRAASGFMRELFMKANVKDNRYLFY